MTVDLHEEAPTAAAQFLDTLALKLAAEVVMADRDLRDDARGVIRGFLIMAEKTELAVGDYVVSLKPAFENYCVCHNEHIGFCPAYRVPGTVVEIRRVEVEPYVSVTRRG